MTQIRRAFAWALVFAIVLSSFDADARRRRRRRSRGPKVVAEKPLIERMGGRKALDAVIDDFLKRAAQDPRLKASVGRFEGGTARLSKLRAQISERLCESAGGPCRYSGPSVASIKKTVQIRDEEFLAAAESLSDSLDERGVPEREKNELLAIVGGIRAEIVVDAPAWAMPPSAPALGDI